MTRAGEILEASRSALVVIDEQGKLMEMVERPRMVLGNTVRLLKLARHANSVCGCAILSTRG